MFVRFVAMEPNVPFLFIYTFFSLSFLLVFFALFGYNEKTLQ
jgi:hypothetical protein